MQIFMILKIVENLKETFDYNCTLHVDFATWDVESNFSSLNCSFTLNLGRHLGKTEEQGVDDKFWFS
jgi:hypothetical protein